MPKARKNFSVNRNAVARRPNGQGADNRRVTRSMSGGDNRRIRIRPPAARSPARRPTGQGEENRRITTGQGEDNRRIRRNSPAENNNIVATRPQTRFSGDSGSLTPIIPRGPPATILDNIRQVNYVIF